MEKSSKIPKIFTCRVATDVIYVLHTNLGETGSDLNHAEVVTTLFVKYDKYINFVNNNLLSCLQHKCTSVFCPEKNQCLINVKIHLFEFFFFK
jgi:hypothetical protein